MNGTDPLQGLRDIHPPEPVSLWPPAPGWWLLLAALLVTLASWALIRYGRQRTAATRHALQELDRLTQHFRQQGDSVTLVRGLSILLRRYALNRFPMNEVAGLTGEAWLEFLDRTGGEGAFRQGPGKVLAHEPYTPQPQVDGEQLIALTHRWLKQTRPRLFDSQGGRRP